MKVVVDLVYALVVAAAFAGVGELILFRSSRTLREVFEAFAVGSGVSAAILFPLSLAAGRHALNILTFLLLACFLVALSRRRRRSETREGVRAERIDSGDPLTLIFLALIAASWVCFAFLNWRLGFLWDGFETWASLAQMLYVEGMLAPERFPEAAHIGSKIRYPQLLPLYEALIATMNRGFDFDRFKPLFLIYYTGLLVMTFDAARWVAGARTALGVTALVGLLPPVSSGFAAGGYADMPMGFYLVVLTAAVVRPRDRSAGGSPIPWLVGTLGFVKAEGLVYVAIILVAGAVSEVLSDSVASVVRRARAAIPALLVIGAMAATRIAWLIWIGQKGRLFTAGREEMASRLLDRLADAAELVAYYLFSPHGWGFFWPAFLAALIIVFRRREPILSAIGIFVVASMAAFVMALLVSSWEMAVLMEQTFARFLAHIAPTAAVVIAAAFRLSWDGSSPLHSSDAGEFKSLGR